MCYRKDKFTENFRWKKKLQTSVWRVSVEQMMMKYHFRMWSGPTPAHERPLASYTVTDVRVPTQADNLLTSRPSSSCRSAPLSSIGITTLLSQRHIDGTCYLKVSSVINVWQKQKPSLCKRAKSIQAERRPPLSNKNSRTVHALYFRHSRGSQTCNTTTP